MVEAEKIEALAQALQVVDEMRHKAEEGAREMTEQLGPLTEEHAEKTAEATVDEVVKESELKAFEVRQESERLMKLAIESQELSMEAAQKAAMDTQKSFEEVDKLPKNASGTAKETAKLAEEH